MNKDTTLGSNYIFLVGSPRSGTTILNEVLGRHPDIKEWYEPYFIWDWFIGNKADDIRTKEDAFPKNVDFIRREFHLYHKKSRKKYIIEKLPEHSFQIPYIHAVFPEAKFIHIVRDGRSSSLSMNVEWKKRENIVKKRSFIKLFKIAKAMLKRQPFFRNKLQALFFEFKNQKSLNPFKFLNKSKWKGKAGWGPRFKNWETQLQSLPLIEFNATQWLQCLKSIEQSKSIIPKENWFEIHYEDFVKNPKAILENLCEFLKLPSLNANQEYLINHDDISPDRINRWKKTLSKKEIKSIEKIASTMLQKKDYEIYSA